MARNVDGCPPLVEGYRDNAGLEGGPCTVFSSLGPTGTADDGAQAGRAEQAAARMAHLDPPRQDALPGPGCRGRQRGRHRQGYGRIQDRRGEPLPAYR